MTAPEEAGELTLPSNRSFGLLFAGAFSVIGLWPLIDGSQIRLWALIAAALFLFAALFAPSVLSIPNRLWMKFGLILGRIISPIAMGLLFVIVFVPVGVLMRIFGRDHLVLKRKPQGSYWHIRPCRTEGSSMKNQF